MEVSGSNAGASTKCPSVNCGVTLGGVESKSRTVMDRAVCGGLCKV